MLARWDLVEADLHERYGIDVDNGILARRSWRWLRTRILALLDVPPHISPNGQVIPATRLGLALRPPEPPKE